MKNTVLYHKNCTDGFMSAFILYKYFTNLQEETEYIAVNYNQPIPVITGKHIYIVDFSYSQENIDKITELYKPLSVQILDHHDTSAESYGGYGTYKPVSKGCICDCSFKFVEEKSGAGMVYDFVVEKYNSYMFKSDELQKRIDLYYILDQERFKHLVDRVEDRDLWRFSLPGTLEAYELLNSIENTFESWDNLIFKDSDEVFKEKLNNSRTIVQFRDKLARNYAAKKTIVNFEGYQVPVVNCPADFSSIVGDKLSAEHPFAVMFVVGSYGCYMSMRSKTKTGVDVSKIALKYGGGGHINAAAFHMNNKHIDTFMSGNYNIDIHTS